MSTKFFQADFHARWSHLQDPHVRALAWLIDAPDLLDPQAPQWRGRIATLTPYGGLDHWLTGLDKAPAELHAYLAIRPFERLGRYAEKLLAYYFVHRGILLAHGVQVHASDGQTIGEFDYLLRDGSAMLHWEFATKLYLLESSAHGDYFVGPNLADTLIEKMRKILDRQLALGMHAAAQVYLPDQITRASALIKGWLFYHQDDQAPLTLGVAANHCRGYWCELAQAPILRADCFALLPRLAWLAPLQSPVAQTLDRTQLMAALYTHFENDSMPVMVANLSVAGDIAYEFTRGFVVPDDWRERAGQRAQRAFIAARRSSFVRD